MRNICVSQITMTTRWLLLLLVVVVSSRVVYSQSTTGEQPCDGGEQLRELKEDIKTFKQDIKTLLDKQLRTVMTYIAAIKNGLKRDSADDDSRRQHENQTAMNRLGKM